MSANDETNGSDVGRRSAAASPATTEVLSAPFAPVVSAFTSWLDEDPTYAGQLAVYHHGELVVDVTLGAELSADALLPVFSSSKGVVGIVMALLVERGQLDLDASVSAYWAEFAQSNKGAITVRELLSHQAGLPGVDGGYSREDLLLHTPLARKLAAQRPYWVPGTAFAYHAVTIGTLADELVRRITGRTLAEVFYEDVAAPRQIDVHLGLRSHVDHRVVEIEPPDASQLAAWLAQSPPPSPDDLGWQALPRDGQDVFALVNDADFRRTGPPAGGAVATARGLARMYAAVHHDLGAPRLLSDSTVTRMSQVQANGVEIGGFPARFGVVFQLPFPPMRLFGSTLAFGHDGAGGSLAFSDPASDIAVGYVPRRMTIPEPGTEPDTRIKLMDVIHSCATA